MPLNEKRLMTRSPEMGVSGWTLVTGQAGEMEKKREIEELGTSPCLNLCTLSEHLLQLHVWSAQQKMSRGENYVNPRGEETEWALSSTEPPFLQAQRSIGPSSSTFFQLASCDQASYDLMSNQ